MKKLLQLILLSVSITSTIISCNDDFSDDSSNIEESEVTNPYYVSYDSALSIALQQLSLEKGPGTRSTVSRSVLNHYLYSHSPRTRSIDAVDARFHIINFTDNQGFAIISADSRTTSVYAYSSEGNINIEDAVANTGIGEFMNCAEEFYINEIEQYGKGPIKPIEPDSSLIDLMIQVPVIVDGIECVQRQITTYDNQGYLLTTAWHQSWPYNSFCPTYINNNGITKHYYAGCGPIAMSQIMTYHGHPSSYGEYYFNWNNIRSSSNVSPNDTCKARLVRIAGIVSNATYLPEGTSTTITNMKSAFQQMGYTTSQVKTMGSNTIQDIKSGIASHQPLYFRGTDNESDEGHAWVVDGYNSTKYQTVYYYAYFPYPEYKTVTNSEKIYYHCNFGWGESGNGYYLNVYENIYGRNIKYLHLISPNY